MNHPDEMGPDGFPLPYPRAGHALHNASGEPVKEPIEKRPVGRPRKYRPEDIEVVTPKSNKNRTSYYQLYQGKMRADGRLTLADETDERICKLLADGETPESILALHPLLTMENITNRLEKIAKDEAAQRRIAWLKKYYAKQDYEPDTDDEVLRAVKKRLWDMGRNCDEPKDRISALDRLAKLVIAEKELAAKVQRTDGVTEADERPEFDPAIEALIEQQGKDERTD